MPLIIAPLNKELKIIKVLLDFKIKKHLESLGLVVNEKITIISKTGGNLICIIKEGRLALDKDISSKIFVV